jgi:hypothetical protein
VCVCARARACVRACMCVYEYHEHKHTCAQHAAQKASDVERGEDTVNFVSHAQRR